MLLSKEEFQAELQHWTEVAGELFVESEGDLQPHLVVLVNDGARLERHMLYIADGFRDEQTKLATMKVLGACYGRKGQPVVAAFFICEAWRSKMPVGQKPVVTPSEDPNHDEVLIVSGITIELHQSSAVALIARDDGGRTLGAFETWESETTNRLLALFLTTFSQAYMAHLARLN